MTDPVEQLTTARKSGKGALFATFLKMSGPGWLQSAITLGGGSLAGALYLGAIGGSEMLWVQLFAMIFGAIMLGAISYVTLSIPETPFQGMRKHINPVLAWGWLAATLMANMIWIMPQFALAYAAITENLASDWISNPDSLPLQFGLSLVLFSIVAWITWEHDRRPAGIRWYERVLKVLVALIVLSFMAVIAMLGSQLDWGAIFWGFLPNLALISNPGSAYQEILAGITDPAAQSYWHDTILSIQRDRMIAAAATAVGINMTFLMPYALLARGWNKSFRTLSFFDLSFGMVLPFVLATGCIVIASGISFQGQPYEGLISQSSSGIELNEDSPKFVEWQTTIQARVNTLRDSAAPVSDDEKLLAAMLIPRSNRELASSLSRLTGNSGITQWIFGTGVLAMTLSTIAILVLISVFVFREIAASTGISQGSTWPKKAAILLGATGLFWPVLWQGTARAYLAVPASVVGFTLLPIAFVAFFWMMNSRKLMGDERPYGTRRIVWNVLMGAALATSGVAAVLTGWNTSLAGFPLGRSLLIGFLVALLAGHFWMKFKNSRPVLTNGEKPGDTP